jgi:hypothetical protein
LQLLIALVAVEALMALLLRAPALDARLPEPLVELVRTLYTYQDRNIIQFDARTARFDSSLFYTLRPGTFVFENREFRNEYRVNRAGMRDDEESLDSPRIIAAGDSITMGWGVEQDEAFPQRIEQALGDRALNAGVSSYGTARELSILERAHVDPARLEAIVIQYSTTDFTENAAYFTAGGQLPTSDEPLFDSIARYQEEARRYRPFLYIEILVRRAIGVPGPGAPKSAFAQTSLPRSVEEEARVFLYTLEQAMPAALRDARVIVTHIDIRLWNAGTLLAEMDRLRREEPDGSLARRAVFVDLSARLHPEDLYVIDDHIRASGHETVARSLLEILAQQDNEGTLQILD